MILEQAFQRLLGLDESWAVAAAEYETEPVELFFLVLRETEKLCSKLTCPVATGALSAVICHRPTETRVWRCLDAFGKRIKLLLLVAVSPICIASMKYCPVSMQRK